jgi:hypothetical protein
MRWYTEQHRCDWGIDWPARTRYVCVLTQAGEGLVHRHMSAGPETFLKTMAPYRDKLVVWVECLCTWSWLADRCAPEGLPVILGHALSMKASHGGKAKNEKLDA